MAVADQERNWRGQFVSAGNATTVVGLDDVEATLKRLQTSNPNMRRDINKIISYVIREGAKHLRQQQKTQMVQDPRKAYMAVKSMVYKRLFGGNVNIISRRHNNGKMYVGVKPKKLKPGQRGGNRRERSEKTNRIDSYYGSDRGFILRWINNGTNPRHISTNNDGSGNRGRLAGTGAFGTQSQVEMEAAAHNMASLIEDAIEQIWGSKDGLAKVRNMSF